jgi:coenzyme F420-reducing hydrogenase delta subunit
MNPDRIQMVNISAAMAAEFIEKTNQMHDVLLGIGPNPIKDTKDI